MPREFLGVGWKFPIRVNGAGSLSYTQGEAYVQEAIWLVLGTAKGELPMRPQFGCGIHDFVFAPNNATTRGSVAHHVHEALSQWEPRIDVLDVRVEQGAQENLLFIRVDYRIRSNNSFHNLVYPFYLREGSGA